METTPEETHFFGIKFIRTRTNTTFSVVYNNVVGLKSDTPVENSQKLKLNATLKGQCKMIANSPIRCGNNIFIETKPVYTLYDEYFSNFTNFINRADILNRRAFVIAMKIIEEKKSHLFSAFYPRIPASSDVQTDINRILLLVDKDMDYFNDLQQFVLLLLVTDDLQVKKRNAVRLFPSLFEILVDKTKTHSEAQKLRAVSSIMLGGLKIIKCSSYNKKLNCVNFFKTLSSMNHSCWPNATNHACVNEDKNSPMIVCFANKDIGAGEEITIAYTPIIVAPTLAPVTLNGRQANAVSIPSSARRRSHILEDHMFNCICGRCSMADKSTVCVEIACNLMCKTANGLMDFVSHTISLRSQCELILEKLNKRENLPNSILDKYIEVATMTIYNVSKIAPKYSSHIYIPVDCFLKLIHERYEKSSLRIPNDITSMEEYILAKETDLYLKKIGKIFLFLSLLLGKNSSDKFETKL